MRKIRSGMLMLFIGVVVGAVLGGGFFGHGGSRAAAASPVEASASPTVSPTVPTVPTVPEATPTVFGGSPVAPGASSTGPGVSEDPAAPDLGERIARLAAQRATGTDSDAVTFGGQSLPDLTVVPPSRTDGPLRLTVGLGDSITYRAGSWFRRVCGSGVLQTCRDAGVRGDTTAGMVARLDADVLALHPQVVTVMAGTNDMLADFDARQTMRNLDEIVTRAEDSGATVVLCTIAPRNLTPGEVLVLNAAIRKYARSHRVPLLDAYPLLGTSQGTYRRGLTHDGVHPNAVGMRLIADYAEQKLPRLIGTVR